MLRALRAELAKLRGARVVLWTALAVASVPALTSPSVIATEGLEKATWKSFMLLAPQMMASWWAVLIFGLAAAYVFGREYFDGTAKNMLTLPIRREAFVAAKLLVLAVWVAGLALIAVAMQALFAVVLGIDGFAWSHVWNASMDCLEIAGLIYLTLPVVGVLAMLERGYVPPMVFSAFMTTAALMVGVTNGARYFPWSMPLAAAGSAFGPMIEPPQLTAWSFVIVGALFVAGSSGLVLYIDHADNLQ